MAFKYLLAMFFLNVQLLASPTTKIATLETSVSTQGKMTPSTLYNSENDYNDSAVGAKRTFPPNEEKTKSVPFYQPPRGIFVSDEVIFYSRLVIYTWICLLLGVLGVATNIINCLVFWRQGFKDGVNISMTSIALWDLVQSLASIFHRVGGVIGMVCPAEGTSWRKSTFPSLGHISINAGYVSSVLAAYVSVERCLCVSMPFKVKSFFTPKFTLVMVILISVVVSGAFFIVFFIYDITYRFSREYNASVALFVHSHFYRANEQVVMPYHKTMSILVPCLSFALLCACSVTTVYFLRKSSDTIRGKANVRGSKSSTLTHREKQVAKMLSVIVLIYIINLLPRIAMFFASLVEPEFFTLGKYNNLFVLMGHILYILDYINGSTNLFIFLKMSSNFRETFSAMFSMCTKK